MNGLSRALLAVLFVMALSGAAFADGAHDRTQFGRDINVGPGEEASDATCFACSVRVRGHVEGDVTTFGGNVVVEDQGEINGDTTTFGGNVRLEKGIKVNGGVTVFGGRLYRDSTATIGGDVTNFSGSAWLVLIFGLPLVLLGAFIALIVWLVRRLTQASAPAAT
jgi:hypothetical protein